MKVHLEVQSNSGLSQWNATIDFSDYGQLTGRYWLTSDNDRSQVPSYFANTLRAEIEARSTAGKRVEYLPATLTENSDRASEPARRPMPPGWYPTAEGPRYWNGQGWDQTYPVAYAQPSQHFGINSPRSSGVPAIVIAWLITFVTLGYMLPWAIAVTRGTPNRSAIGLICFLTGWTVVGWVVALIMACAT